MESNSEAGPDAALALASSFLEGVPPTGVAVLRAITRTMYELQCKVHKLERSLATYKGRARAKCAHAATSVAKRLASITPEKGRDRDGQDFYRQRTR